MTTFSRRRFAAALACVPAVPLMSTLALADDAPLPKPEKQPLRIYSTAKGDKLTITNDEYGRPIFTWTAKEDLKD